MQNTALEHAPSITIAVNCDENAASLKVFTTVLVDGKYDFPSTKYEMFSLHSIVWGFPFSFQYCFYAEKKDRITYHIILSMIFVFCRKKNKKQRL